MIESRRLLKRRSRTHSHGKDTHNQSCSRKTVESLKHDEAKRKNIPTAEYQSVLKQGEVRPDPRGLRAA